MPLLTDLLTTNTSNISTNTSKINTNIPASLGTAGQVLTVNSGATAGEWADAAGGATQINELTDGYSDGSSVGLGPNALLNDDGTTNINVAVGLDALRTNTSGNNTVAIGNEAAYSQTNGGQNVFIGTKAGRNATSRTNVTVVGHFAAYSMSSSGDLNTYIGNTAGYSHNSGGTTVVGGNALQQATSAYGATAVGSEALKNTTTGNYNTALGHTAGESNTTGYGNTFIGGDAGRYATTINNCIVLGYNATPASNTTSSNEITLGNNSITTLRCNTQTISSLSDERDKKNIKDIEIGLDFLKTLRPVSFDWDQRDGGRVDKPDIGFIAQELLEAQEQCDVSVPNLVSTINPEKLEAAYATLIPVLVQAIKELSEELDTLKNKGV